MAFPLLKLIDLTGPAGFADHVALVEIIQEGPHAGSKFQVSKVRLEPNAELGRTIHTYDNQTFVPFTNALQFRFLIVDADGGHELGETIIDAVDIGQPEEKFIKIFVDGMIGNPFYQLGYRILPQ